MKRLFVLLFSLLLCNVSYADTETINWYVDGTSYATTTCQTGGDIILPNTPYKYGYTFQGWNAYTLIEYLESTGTQYIDTGYVHNTNSRLSLSVKIGRPAQYISGEKAIITNSRNSARIGFGIFYNNGLIRCFNAPWTSENINAQDTNMLSDTIIINGWFGSDGFYCDFANSPKTGNEYNTQSSFSILLFSRWELESEYNFPGKIYYAKIYENNNLVRDFVPVLDDNGIPCMYDKVTQQFFYNQGTGNFIAGPVINQ